MLKVSVKFGPTCAKTRLFKNQSNVCRSQAFAPRSCKCQKFDPRLLLGVSVACWQVMKENHPLPPKSTFASRRSSAVECAASDRGDVLIMETKNTRRCRGHLQTVRHIFLLFTFLDGDGADGIGGGFGGWVGCSGRPSFSRQ